MFDFINYRLVQQPDHFISCPKHICHTLSMTYLSVSAVVFHYEEALYEVHAPLPLPLQNIISM